ncbi:hypothetical protein [Sphingomonas sp.]|uniref:hypothetical protein n=1 Tax=Sphingomonas sp. TaxID=28214 RepID=UPI001B17DF1C|nr:hypothetical protein [Sphingomonas sp.]MBO9711962.1 hypothetical protein [Sphingomonas sp.]
MSGDDSEARVERFIARFEPGLADRVRAARARLRSRFPGAFELVYDNYNALAIGFASTPKTADVAISLAVYPRRVLLYFYYGASLADPHGPLEGEGRQGRYLCLKDVTQFDDPRVHELLVAAEAHGRSPTPEGAGGGAGHVIIKSVAARQRSRRPQGEAA